MGYAFVVASCIACGTLITFNPHKVPSIKVRWTADGPVVDEEGKREPLCRGCAEKLNENRVEAGLEAVPIQPDAYEAINELEL